MREFRIGRLQGRFVVTWREGGVRRRYRLTAGTAREAESEALGLVQRLRLAEGHGTVAELWAQYREARGDRPAIRTMHWTGKPILEHFGARDPIEIGEELTRSYTAARRKAGISDGAIWTELGHLSTVLNWAAKTGRIERAPKIERPAKPAPRDRFLTRAEIDRLLAVDAPPHIRVAILLMLTTAARVGAILDLTWSRVDLERGQIDLRLPDSTTRKGRAVVPINPTLRAALTVAHAGALSDHVVEWAGDRVASIRRGFSAACAAAGLEGVTPHVLRHTAAVHMAEGGVPMSVISQYLGHSNEAITARVYARYSPDYLRGAAEILDFGRVRQVR
jgi:integrase